MVKKTLEAHQVGPSLDDLFTARRAAEKAAVSAEKARDKADRLKKKYDQLANETDLEDRLYTDVSGKVWFFDGYRFSQVQSD